MNNMGVGVVSLSPRHCTGVTFNSNRTRVSLSLPNEKMLEREVIQSCVAGL